MSNNSMSNNSSSLSEKKWKYISIGLMAILALGFSFPHAFAAPIDSVLNIVKDIQAKVNNATFGLQATKSAVDTKASQESVNEISTKLGEIPGRVVTFNNLQLDLAENENYEIIPQDNFVHGIYVDITVSGLEGLEGLGVSCETDTGAASNIVGISNGKVTLDMGCDGLSFEGELEGATATVNGTIRYTNEYISQHDQVPSP